VEVAARKMKNDKKDAKDIKDEKVPNIGDVLRVP
jgi:hypothetical protein